MTIRHIWETSNDCPDTLHVVIEKDALRVTTDKAGSPIQTVVLTHEQAVDLRDFLNNFLKDKGATP